ncbi:acetyltransferase, GNAT family [Lachnospiraceae bacterium KM106-2]|nr:acetyltransferase, GNAT family [Lachnospiraceae bacterium KM106-2]
MIRFRKAVLEDAQHIIELQNKAFYDDYQEFGVCPAYGCSLEQIEEAIKTYITYVICDEERIVGKISVHKVNEGHYFVDCLCILPDYQGRGLGSEAIRFVELEMEDATYWSLVTPKERPNNHEFYRKSGYIITGETKDQDVELVELEKQCISYCGLNCNKCPVYIATSQKDDSMKEEVAKTFSTEEMPLEAKDIYCLGCHTEFADDNKICGPCKIRACATGRKVEVCGKCNYYPCNKIEQFVPKGSENRELLDQYLQ